jgi:hypothetical protein
VTLGDDLDVPSATAMAVALSIAYAEPPMPAAHFSAAAVVFVGRVSSSRCGIVVAAITASTAALIAAIALISRKKIDPE